MSDQALAAVLDAVRDFVRRFVVMTDHQATAVTLWCLHTHTVDASDYTPYLFVTSAERESGKSRLKEVCGLLVANPVLTSNVSPAALFRIASPKDGPPATFLVDEVDEIFAPKSDRSELRGLLNAGFHRGDHAIRMVGEGAKQQPEKFDVYCPKLLAGKSTAVLGDTLESRCITIELKRKTREEHVDRFRRRDVDDQAVNLHEALRSLGSLHVDALAEARPDLHDELTDRQNDVWEPLLAIADIAGGEWAQWARHAAAALSSRDTIDDESAGVRLLAACQHAFNGHDVLATKDLIAILSADDEAPWGTWHHGTPISPRALSDILRKFRIRSRTVRIDNGDTPKGFKAEQFSDAWNRYLPPFNPDLSATTPQPASAKGWRPSSIRHTDPHVADRKEAANPHEQRDVADVADKAGERGMGADRTP